MAPLAPEGGWGESAPSRAGDRMAWTKHLEVYHGWILGVKAQ